MKTRNFLPVLLAVGIVAACSKDNGGDSDYADDMVVNIPDATFNHILLKLYDKDGDGKIQYGEIKDVETLSLDILYTYPEGTKDDKPVGTGIGSIQGIEYFSSLKELKFVNGDTKHTLFIPTMDLSKNWKLTTLDCSYTKVSNFKVGNIPLETLSCAGNNLRYVSTDFSKLKSLRYLDFSGNGLIHIDLTNNTQLTYLNCARNPLSTIDLSKNSKLETLVCDTCALTSLSVENLSALKELQCQKNPIRELDLRNNKSLATLDCSKCPWLGAILVPGGKDWTIPAGWNWTLPSYTEFK